MQFSSSFITKRTAFSDRLFWLFFGSWFLSIFISLIYILINFSSLPKEIPLFYSRVWGEEQLAKNIYIFLPVTGIFLLGIFDFGLAISWHSRDRVFSYLLFGTASLAAILVLVTTVNIINLVK